MLEKHSQKLPDLLLSFAGLSFILAIGPYLTLKSAPALGTLLTLLP